MASGKVYVAGTCDTKGDELRYVKRLIEAAGVPAVLVDLGTKGEGGAADVPAREVAAHHPGGRGRCSRATAGRSVAAMAEAFERFVRGAGRRGGADRARRVGRHGARDAGDAGAAGGRAEGDGRRRSRRGTSRPTSAPSDIAMMYSVTDVAGLNRISRAGAGATPPTRWPAW